MNEALRKRCEARLKTILENKDEGVYAKAYAEDVALLLYYIEDLEAADDGSGTI
jgi:hypothetical protein